MQVVDFMFSILRELSSIASQSAAYDKWPDSFSRKEIREVWGNLKGPLRNRKDIKISIAELNEVPRDQLFQLGFGNWNDNLILIPLWLFNYIADGEVLHSISGESKIKGTDEIDLDVRFGCIAYGFNKIN